MIAVRASIRVFPIGLLPQSQYFVDEKAIYPALIVTRRLLTAAVVAQFPTDEAKEAAGFAVASDKSIGPPRGGYSRIVATYTAEAAYSFEVEKVFEVIRCVNMSPENGLEKAQVPAATRDVMEMIYSDTNLSLSQLLATPLWQKGGEPQWLLDSRPLDDRIIEKGQEWSFWRDWYQGFLNGKPLDWELQRRVALIPDEDWEKGPEHIAEIIEKIRLQFKTQTTPPLVRDEKREVFTVESDDTLPRDVLEFACTRITIAYDAAIDASSENGFREDSYEASLIQRALAEFATHPSLLATSFFDACLSFQRTIGERYPEDTSLINLQNALYGVVEEINEQHEDARHRCARLAKLAQPEPISVDDMQALKEVPDMVADQVDTHAGQIIESDVERMLSTPNPPKSVRARFANWITTISMWMDKAMKGDKRAQWLAGLVGRLIKWFPGGE